MVPPGLESSGQPLAHLLARIADRDGLGIEIVSHVNNIPKGSRLAVSTNLLASLISVCMRATGQVSRSPGLAEPERRLVAARAILGEWLGGSGGGWQDSGGVWPGIKLIEGVLAAEGDAEFGVSRGGCCRITAFSRNPRSARRRAAAAGQPGAGARRHGAGRGAHPRDGHREYLLRSEAEWPAVGRLRNSG